METIIIVSIMLAAILFLAIVIGRKLRKITTEEYYTGILKRIKTNGTSPLRVETISGRFLDIPKKGEMFFFQWTVPEKWRTDFTVRVTSPVTEIIHFERCIQEHTTISVAFKTQNSTYELAGIK